MTLAVPFALAVAAADLSPGDAFSPPPAPISLAYEPPTNGFMVRHIPDEPLPAADQGTLPRCSRLPRARPALAPAGPGGEALRWLSARSRWTPRRGAERARTARLIHESLGLLSSKWAVDVLLALGDGTRRYHQLLADLEPISEKVLTQTLRAMERDGLVGRRVHPEVPPRVEYALTPLGATLAGPLRALGAWSVAHGKRVEEARGRSRSARGQRSAAGRRVAVVPGTRLRPREQASSGDERGGARPRLLGEDVRQPCTRTAGSPDVFFAHEVRGRRGLVGHRDHEAAIGRPSRSGQPRWSTSGARPAQPIATSTWPWRHGRPRSR